MNLLLQISTHILIRTHRPIALINALLQASKRHMATVSIIQKHNIKALRLLLQRDWMKIDADGVSTATGQKFERVSSTCTLLCPISNSVLLVLQASRTN